MSDSKPRLGLGFMAAISNILGGGGGTGPARPVAQRSMPPDDQSRYDGYDGAAFGNGRKSTKPHRGPYIRGLIGSAAVPNRQQMS